MVLNNFLSILLVLSIYTILLVQVTATALSPLSLIPSAKQWKPRFPLDAYFARGRASMCVGDPRAVRWVFENHLRQLNKCSVPGLKRERTPDTQLFFGPNVIRGVSDVDAVFSNFCKPRSEGGLNGLKFTEEKAFIVGNVISVQWVANASFLAEPYPGSDAFVTCGYKVLTIVSSFNEAELNFKE